MEVCRDDAMSCPANFVTLGASECAGLPNNERLGESFLAPLSIEMEKSFSAIGLIYRSSPNFSMATCNKICLTGLLTYKPP